MKTRNCFRYKLKYYVDQEPNFICLILLYDLAYHTKHSPVSGPPTCILTDRDDKTALFASPKGSRGAKLCKTDCEPRLNIVYWYLHGVHA